MTRGLFSRPGVATAAVLVAIAAAPLCLLTAAAEAASTTLVINEIDYDQPGTDTAEFIELKNVSGAPISTAGWAVDFVNGLGGGAVVYNVILLPAVSLAAGDYFVVCANAANTPNCDFDMTPDTNLIQNGAPDAIGLRNPANVLVDAVSYEGNSGAPYTEGSGNGLEDSGADANAGISRCPDGVDTDRNNVDFLGPRPITPGAANDCPPPPPADPVINEFVANHVGTDTHAFVEVFGEPSTSYAGFTVLEIEGDGSLAGIIDAARPVGTTNAGGYWTDPVDMENGTLTILLVQNFTGTLGSDLDTNNDGVLDSTPWTRIVDDVAVNDGGSGDRTYSSTVLTAFFDGQPFHPGGASRIPNGADTNSVGDWVRNDFDGFGLPGFPGTPALGEAVNTPGAVNALVTVPTDPIGACGDAATRIHAIQGSGPVSPDLGSIREIQGIVTGDFEPTTQLRGFFVQEEDGDFDGDPTTSEGIFVFNNGFGPGVSTSQTVRVRGAVTEFNGLTQLSGITRVLVCPATGVANPVAWSLPVAAVGDWEWVEGMEVVIDQTLYVSGNFTLGRFGEVDLAVGGPLDNPTNVVAPGAPALALQALNNRSRIQLDDGSTVQNPLPLPPYLGADNTLRTGDTVPGLSGVVGFAFGVYEIHPTQPVVFSRVSARPGVPGVGGSLRVAAFNVLNYFTTLDNAGPICGPLGNQGCRGADNAFEFGRQRAKLVTAISTLDAHVVGLMEIENHPSDDVTADLVAGLNAATAPGTYDFIPTGAIGGDAIRVALIYQPATVTPAGSFEVLDSADDPTFDDTKNRPVLAQSFVDNATGAVFTVAVNHLKSKGSPCNDVGDPDAGDGQGNCNGVRTAAAQALVDWLATDPTASDSSDFLILGDLNSYAQEDPIVAIEAAGYTDLIETFLGSGFAAGAYSLNFQGQSGYLDHALASGSLVPRVTGAAFWHVNADEPVALDYNDFNQPLLFQPDQFRSSDHDPVVVGLALVTPRSLKQSARDGLAALPSTGDRRIDHLIGKAIGRIDESLNPAWWTGPSTLDSETGNHVFDREHQAVIELQKVGSAGALAAIAKLIEADLLLALKRLTAAVDAGGDPERIAEAQADFAQATAQAAAGAYANAVLSFKRAWTNAGRAMS